MSSVGCTLPGAAMEYRPLSPSLRDLRDLSAPDRVQIGKRRRCDGSPDFTCNARRSSAGRVVTHLAEM
jgi:hypothetical protein